jgi:hypothetical protein
MLMPRENTKKAVMGIRIKDGFRCEVFPPGSPKFELLYEVSTERPCVWVAGDFARTLNEMAPEEVTFIQTPLYELDNFPPEDSGYRRPDSQFILEKWKLKKLYRGDEVTWHELSNSESGEKRGFIGVAKGQLGYEALMQVVSGWYDYFLYMGDCHFFSDSHLANSYYHFAWLCNEYNGLSDAPDSSIPHKETHYRLLALYLDILEYWRTEKQRDAAEIEANEVEISSFAKENGLDIDRGRTILKNLRLVNSILENEPGSVTRAEFRESGFMFRHCPRELK